MVVECLSKAEIIGDVTYTYCYRLIKGQVSLSISEEDIVVQTYGIEIERKDAIDGVVVNIERDSVETISPQRYKVHNLLKLLYDNLVSPVHLVEVIGEYIDEYIIDFDKALYETANSSN